MSPIRILYFTPNFGTGGTERLVFELCRNLDQTAFDVSVCSFFPGMYSAELNRLGKPHHVITGKHAGDAGVRSIIGKISGFYDRLKRIKRIIESERIDIVNTHHLGPFIHVIAVKPFLKRRVRLVHTEHNFPDETIYNRHLVTVCRSLMRHVDAVTGVSEKVASYFHESWGMPAVKVHAILNGVNTEAFRMSIGGGRVRASLGIDDGAWVIGMIGNLRTEKNQRVLIDAFSRLNASGSDAHLVLAGDGPCRPALERQAAELGISHRVHFLGHRMDAPDVMAAFDVYCLPSIFEGMPLSILEAWAAGKPVVATDVTGIRDIVIHEKNGLLVPVNDPDKLAEGISRVLHDDDLKERISTAGQRYALEQCSMEAMVRRYESLYRQLSGRQEG